MIYDAADLTRDWHLLLILYLQGEPGDDAVGQKGEPGLPVCYFMLNAQSHLFI